MREHWEHRWPKPHDESVPEVHIGTQFAVGLKHQNDTLDSPDFALEEGSRQFLLTKAVRLVSANRSVERRIVVRAQSLVRLPRLQQPGKAEVQEPLQSPGLWAGRLEGFSRPAKWCCP